MSNQEAVAQVASVERWSAVKNGTLPEAPSDSKKKEGVLSIKFDRNTVEHVSIDYIILEVMEGAIGVTSDAMEKTADLQKNEDSIHTIINHLGKFIQTIATYKGDAKGNMDWNAFMNDPDIQKQLKDLRAEWKDLFGKGGSTKNLMEDWKKLLGKDAENNPSYSMVKDLEKGFDSTWENNRGASFHDWLAGNDGIDKLDKAFTNAWKQNQDHSNPDPTKRGNKDPLGISTNSITSTGSTVGGLTNSNSAKLTQNSQEFTSFVQIAQKVLEDMKKLKGDEISNQMR